MMRAPELEQEGLSLRRVAPASAAGDCDVERKIGDWLVCYLDDRDPEQHSASFEEMLGAGSLILGKDQKRRRAKGSGKRDLQARHWGRIAVRRRRSVVVVTLLDSLLIKENVIDELAAELNDLVRAGDRRMVLNFTNVERMSSQIVAVVSRLHQVCAASPGGMLKLCVIDPAAVDLFRLLGVEGGPEICSDEQAALAGPWPESPGPRPLPVSILSALTGATRKASRAPWDGVRCGDDEASDGRDGGADAPSLVWLVVESGTAGGPDTGSVIPVGQGRFLLGGGRGCQLRLPETDGGKAQAVIERQGPALRLVDLGSGRVTAVNGRVLEGTWARLRNGDRVHLGPVVLRVIVVNGEAELPRIEDVVIAWLHEPEAETEPEIEAEEGLPLADADPDVEASGEPMEDGAPSACTESGLRYRVLQEVLVLTPKFPEVDEQDGVDRLRGGIEELSALDLPVKVVLDLGHVSQVNSHWLGVILSHLLRLERQGGSLRV